MNPWTSRRTFSASSTRSANPARSSHRTPATSNVDEIAASTSRPQDVLGMHFFSPANVMKLLEVVRGEKTAPDALAHRDGHRQEDRQGRGRRGRLSRLHRQPHAHAAPGRGDEAADGRRDARTDRQGPYRFRHADGAVPDERPRRRRYRLAPRSQPGSKICATNSPPRAAGVRRPARAFTITTKSAARRPAPKCRA